MNRSHSAGTSVSLSYTGGGSKHRIHFSKLLSFNLSRDDTLSLPVSVHYIDYVCAGDLIKYPISQGFIHADISLQELTNIVTKQAFIALTKQHEFLTVGSHIAKGKLAAAVQNHHCAKCNTFVTVFYDSACLQSSVQQSR